MCKSIFVWILTGLVARAVGLDFTYTKMEESSGLYFDARGEVQLSATDWKLVTYINIEQVKESLRLTKEHVQAATSFCEGLKNQTWYGMTDCVSFRSYAFSRVRRLGKLRDVLADFTTPSDEFHDRQKRGVLNFVGQISKILFGTLAEDDAEYYSDKISALENEQKEFLRISKEQMIVVKSTIASFNSTFKEVQRNEKILQSGLNKLAKHMDTVSEQLVNETYIISITQTIAEHSLQIQRSMDDCERTFNIILDALVHAQDGILQPQVITPSQIRKLMRSEQLPVGLGYPVTSTSQELLQLIKPKIFIHEKYLIYILPIPLTTSTRYQLFQVIPFPKRTNSTSDKYIYLEPSREFILSEPTRQAYAKLTEKNVEDCLHIDDTRMICKQDFPVINFQAGEDCEASLLHPSTAAIPTSCKQRVLELRNTLWLKLHGNEWLHVSPQPEVVSFLCTGNHTPQSVVLSGQGRIRLESGCKAYGTHATLLAYSTITKNVTFPDVIPTIPLNYECCFNSRRQQILDKLQLHIPLSNVLSNTDELQLTSHKIQEINKMIDEEQWRIDHSSKLHYASWATCVGVIFTVVITTCIISCCCCKCCRHCGFFLWSYWRKHPSCTDAIRHCVIKQRIHAGPVHYHGSTISLPRRSLRRGQQGTPTDTTELMSTVNEGSPAAIAEVIGDEEDTPSAKRVQETKKRGSWR